MLTSKQTNLRPLFESKDGVHLTIYLTNRGELADLKMQLRHAINETYEWLNNVMTIEEQNKFIEPLESLLSEGRILKQMKGNVGIFRNKDSFRILNIPIEIEPSCQVATSFHIKPLLKWLQGDQDFLLLGFESQSAHLYLGNQESMKLIDSIVFAETNPVRSSQNFVWINEWIGELTKKSKPKLFLAGHFKTIEGFLKHNSYVKCVKTPVSFNFDQNSLHKSAESIRNLLKKDSQNKLERTLREFRFAEEDQRAKKNIFQIARAVVRGKVKKLVVTDEINIFGRIDYQTGGLAIHPFDIDHEDDCILDDLAQIVLSQGGEVIVAKRSEIPKGRPILAILDDGFDVNERKDDLNFVDLQEPFR